MQLLVLSIHNCLYISHPLKALYIVFYEMYLILCLLLSCYNSVWSFYSARRERADSEPWEAEDDEDQLEEEYEQSMLANSAPAAPGSGSDLTKSALGLSTASVNKRASQYDIDDIVIPYHIAAATRVEKLQVKEIDTPR